MTLFALEKWGFSMNARTKITRKFATASKASSMADEPVLLDQVCEVTGWSGDSARTRLSHSSRPRGIAATRQRSKKYSFDALNLLQRVWSISEDSAAQIFCGFHAGVA